MMNGRHAACQSATWVGHRRNGNGREHRERTQGAWHLSRKNGCAGGGKQDLARYCVAAVKCTIDQRPDSAGRFSVFRVPAEEPSADSEQNSAALTQSVGLHSAPWERLKQREPRIFKLRQLTTTDPTPEQLPRNGAEAWLRRHRALIQFLQPLAPPGEADRAECRLGRGGDDVG
jgi:hypothetical protein